jgi:hypothetical protein
MDLETAFFDTPIAGLVWVLLLVMCAELIAVAFLAQRERRFGAAHE